MPTLLDRRIPKQAWLTEAGERNGISEKPAPSNGTGEQSRSEDAGPWQTAVQALAGFGKLGDNWDGQGARGPSSDLLASAVGLAYLLSEQEVDPPSRVVPGPAGSVIFEWQYPDGTYAEVEVVEPLYAEAMMVEPGQPAKHWTLPTE
jgi:hypothetical protein